MKKRILQLIGRKQEEILHMIDTGHFNTQRAQDAYFWFIVGVQQSLMETVTDAKYQEIFTDAVIESTSIFIHETIPNYKPER